MTTEEVVLQRYKELEDRIRFIYHRDTGDYLPDYVPEEIQKDMVGRVECMQYYTGCTMNLSGDTIDLTNPDGTKREVKILYCDVDTYKGRCTMLDKRKAYSMNDDDEVTFLYLDLTGNTLYGRDFTIEYIKKEGRVSHSGGKVNNRTKEPSGKPVLYFPTDGNKKRWKLKDWKS